MCGGEVAVLTGEMEALYSANGIKSGFRNASGIVGDMGGGSLELASVSENKPDGQTFPLGGLQLRDLSGGDITKARSITAKYLKKCEVDWVGKSRNLRQMGNTKDL